MPKLKSKPTLKDFQQYITEMEIERGFDQQSARDKCLLMGEEVGELFKAVRKAEGLAIDQHSKFENLSGELADIFIYLCAIANRYEVNLEEAFRQKEIINEKRVWKQAE
ncbi:MazG nucleotide pyrophosphohydrolase domain-containing protein [Persicobacter diffluens]|uniref:NTP pyrophosphohydrolase MazG-like domain-containing protein n=1 Tax=Persicobacter diffluens TaxID=981 RepID=A0AAN4VZ03_9BACT|nr:hypothetical protein PEDI_19620 [Persicobacter diffluens]